MKIKEKKVRKYLLFCQNRPSNISFGIFLGLVKIFFSPPFEIFYPVLALTKVGSALHKYKNFIIDLT
jgi:hypothetical protein